MKTLREEEGQTLVFTALAMTILLGFMALALDVGLLFRAKRKAQIAADAAATAGALDYYYTYSRTSATSMAQSAGQSNRFSSSDPAYNITVNCAPQYGPHAAGFCSGYFEAIVTTANPTVFMGLFGQNPVNVAARAVAGPVLSTSCIYLMNPTGVDFSLQGAAKIQNPDGGRTCGIYVNSSDPNSVSFKGSGDSIDAAYVATQGDISGTGSGNLYDSNNQPIPTATGTAPLDLPDAFKVTAPDPATMTCVPPSGATTKVQSATYTFLSSTSTASPGCYSGDVMIGAPNGTTLNLNPGLYVFSGNVAIGNNVIGNGVTFDIYSGTLTVNSTSNVELHAPAEDPAITTNPYNGVMLLAPDSARDAKCNKSTWNIQWGSAEGTFDGLIVAPCVNLSLNDQGGSALVTGLAVGSLSLKTGTLKIDNYSVEHPTTSPLRSISLVE